MEKELGKWLMDIAKYVVTAVIISSVFSNVKSGWILFASGLTAAVLTLTLGLLLVRDSEVRKKKEENKKNEDNKESKDNKKGEQNG